MTRDILAVVDPNHITAKNLTRLLSRLDTKLVFPNDGNIFSMTVDERIRLAAVITPVSPRVRIDELW
jgi:hypothetical protein